MYKALKTVTLNGINYHPGDEFESDADLSYAISKDLIKPLKSKEFKVKMTYDEIEHNEETLLDDMTYQELRKYAKEKGLTIPVGTKKVELIELIKQA